MSTTLQKNIRDQYDHYELMFPDEAAELIQWKEQLEGETSLYDRKNMRGHATASGIVVSADHEILLVWHNFHERYQQPGGHVDSDDTSMSCAARREVVEETGLRDVTLHPWHEKSHCPINIDTHPIPARSERNEGEHFHHDYMFVFTTITKELDLQLEEVTDWRWITFDEVMSHSGHVATSVRKAQERGLI